MQVLMQLEDQKYVKTCIKVAVISIKRKTTYSGKNSKFENTTSPEPNEISIRSKRLLISPYIIYLFPYEKFQNYAANKFQLITGSQKVDVKNDSRAFLQSRSNSANAVFSGFLGRRPLQRSHWQFLFIRNHQKHQKKT